VHKYMDLIAHDVAQEGRRRMYNALPGWSWKCDFACVLRRENRRELQSALCEERVSGHRTCCRVESERVTVTNSATP
jgi:hypothetical protein